MDKANLYKALTYFDMFSYPLTKVEAKAWQWAGDEPAVNVGTEQIKARDGFYFLTGREEIIKIRQDRYKVSDKKVLKARRIVKIFRLLPSVKMVAICNSLGYQNARQESDIDLFIITSPGKIWLTRFWLTALLKFLRRRPYARGVKQDTFCLTFFLTTDHLNIESLKVADTDVYLTYWLTQLMPLYDPVGIYDKFLLANNWVRQYLPNYIPYQTSNDRQVGYTAWSKVFRPLTWSGWENILKKIQLKIMPVSLKQAANQDSRVVIKDNILKFHGGDDNRLSYLKKWQSRLQT